MNNEELEQLEKTNEEIEEILFEVESYTQGNDLQNFLNGKTDEINLYSSVAYINDSQFSDFSEIKEIQNIAPDEDEYKEIIFEKLSDLDKNEIQDFLDSRLEVGYMNVVKATLTRDDIANFDNPVEGVRNFVEHFKRINNDIEKYHNNEIKEIVDCTNIAIHEIQEEQDYKNNNKYKI